MIESKEYRCMYEREFPSASASPSIFTQIITVVAVVAAAVVFTIVASALTIAIFQIRPGFWLFGLYWGLFAQYLLLAAKKRGMLLSRKKRTNAPDAAMTESERQFVITLFIWMVRVEIVVSLAIFVYSLIGE